MLGDDLGPRQGSDDREAGRNDAGNVHGGLGNADDRSVGRLPCRQDPGVAETGDDVAVDAFALALVDFLQDADDTGGLVVVPLD